MTAKGDELGSFFKRICEKESEFAKETQEMVKKLHRTRDEQVNEIIQIAMCKKSSTPPPL